MPNRKHGPASLVPTILTDDEAKRLHILWKGMTIAQKKAAENARRIPAWDNVEAAKARLRRLGVNV